MKWALLVAILLSSLADAHAQTTISCVPLYEARQQNKSLKLEIRSAIVDSVRRLAQERKLLRQELFSKLGCTDLTCVADEEIVAWVVLQCAVNPFQTLESAEMSIAPVRPQRFGGIF
jgi:hypothetical protein